MQKLSNATTFTICDWFSKIAYPDGMEVEKDIQKQG